MPPEHVIEAAQSVICSDNIREGLIQRALLRILVSSKPFYYRRLSFGTASPPGLAGIKTAHARKSAETLMRCALIQRPAWGIGLPGFFVSSRSLLKLRIEEPAAEAV